MEKEIQADETEASGTIRWPDFVSGSLIKRYKRFLADVRLDTGEIVTAHCPNSGSMKTCATPDQRVFLSLHDSPKRKLKYTWELIETSGSLVGVNTAIPNRLVKTAIENGKIAPLSGYDTVTAEVKTGEHSRLDLLLRKKGRADCFVEVKNCTLVQEGDASFPDAVTERGRKHLVELQDLARAGNRAVMFFLIQRMDARFFHPADDIDPAYGQELRKAHKNGVEILVYDVDITLSRIAIRSAVPFSL